MVGVAGRSKGCRTCKRRRVKCDERQPSCARCEKGGFECEGYGQTLNFVSENARAKKHALRQAALRARDFEDAHSSADEVIWSPLAQEIIKSEPIGNDTLLATICPQMNFSAFKTDIQISFTISKIFSGTETTTKWLSLGYNESQYGISTHALRALSSAFYGRMHGLPQFEEEGRMHYGRALRTMSQALNSDEALSLPVLVGGMIASCYEMVASPDHEGTLQHAGGVGRLVELRGPERHTSEFELHILWSMRLSICIKALLDRKRTFLEKEEWKTIPWSRHPEKKDMTSYILDVICDLPGLVEDFDNANAPNISDKDRQLRTKKLEIDLYDRFKMIYEWRSVWEVKNPRSCWEQPSQLPDSPYSTDLFFDDLDEANGVMLYNAAMIILADIAIPLLGPEYDHTIAALEVEYKITNPALQPPGASLYDAAIEIIRSVEYHLTPPHDNAGAFFIIFPLREAFDHVPEDSDEHNWIRKSMNKIAAKSGFLFSTGIL